MSFEVPPWDDGAQIIKFKILPTVSNDGESNTKKSKTKKKPKAKKSDQESTQPNNSTYRLGQGPLAPPPFSSDDEADDDLRAMHKVRHGRIEKQKPPTKAPKEQKKKLILRSALLQDAVEAMNTQPSVEAMETSKGPQAPPSFSSDDEADDDLRAVHKVRHGRIEKQKPAAKTAKEQKKKLALSPALLHDAMEAMDTLPTVETESSTDAQTTLSSKLKSELLGGRFRYINEQLYTMNSKKAEDLFSKDGGAFEAYHAGYRQQVEKWPTNPLNRIIKTIKRLPKTSIIGDFGCGEGTLAQSVVNKVYSMDLVAARGDIIACNITKTPLEPQCLDVAVYCLSLMGINLTDYLLEANRVLKLHGNVYIAEIQSRFEDVREFVRFMNACGFDLIKKDVAVNYFYFFHFRKMRHVNKEAKIKSFSLKPCLYRKR